MKEHALLGYDLLQILPILSGTLSLLGSAILILTYILFPQWRSFSNRLVVFLCVADMFGACNWYIQNSSFGKLCIVAALMESFFYLSTFFWTAAIHVSFLLTVQDVNYTQPSKWIEIVFHVICWGVPGLLTAIPLIFDEFGPMKHISEMDFGCWYWKREGQLFRFFFFDMWGILTMIFSMSVYFMIVYKLRRLSNPKPLRRMSSQSGAEYDTDNEEQDQLLQKISLSSKVFLFEVDSPQQGARRILLAFIFAWTAEIVLTFTGFFGYGAPFPLLVVFTLTAPAQGFLNFLLYGLVHKKFRRLWAGKCCARRNEDSSVPPLYE